MKNNTEIKKSSKIKVIETITETEITNKKNLKVSSSSNNKEYENYKKEISTILYDENEDFEKLELTLNKSSEFNKTIEEILIEIFGEFILIQMNKKILKFILEKNYLNELNINKFLSKLLSELNLEDSNALIELLIIILLKKKIITPIDFINL
jgi:hypothetical protein